MAGDGRCCGAELAKWTQAWRLMLLPSCNLSREVLLSPALAENALFHSVGEIGRDRTLPSATAQLTVRYPLGPESPSSIGFSSLMPGLLGSRLRCSWANFGFRSRSQVSMYNRCIIYRGSDFRSVMAIWVRVAFPAVVGEPPFALVIDPVPARSGCCGIPTANLRPAGNRARLCEVAAEETATG